VVLKPGFTVVGLNSLSFLISSGLNSESYSSRAFCTLIVISCMHAGLIDPQ